MRVLILTATEHDRPGAVGGPAVGYVLNPRANRNGARPKADPHKAPGRSCSVAVLLYSKYIGIVMNLCAQIQFLRLIAALRPRGDQLARA